MGGFPNSVFRTEKTHYSSLPFYIHFQWPGKLCSGFLLYQHPTLLNSLHSPISEALCISCVQLKIWFSLPYLCFYISHWLHYFHKHCHQQHEAQYFFRKIIVVQLVKKCSNLYASLFFHWSALRAIRWGTWTVSHTSVPPVFWDPVSY